MSTRLLAVITHGQEAAALASLAGLVTIARAARADVRLAYFRRLPPPRANRHGWIVADCDGEMARIAGAATEALASAVRVFDDVATETVVRFGNPAREALVEAEVYTPQIVVCFSAPVAWPLTRLRERALRRRLGRLRDSHLVVLEAPRSHRRDSTRRAAREIGVLGSPRP